MCTLPQKDSKQNENVPIILSDKEVKLLKQKQYEEDKLNREKEIIERQKLQIIDRNETNINYLLYLLKKYNPLDKNNFKKFYFNNSNYNYKIFSNKYISQLFNYKQIYQPKDIAMFLNSNISRLLNLIDIAKPLPPINLVIHNSKIKFINELKLKIKTKLLNKQKNNDNNKFNIKDHNNKLDTLKNNKRHEYVKDLVEKLFKIMDIGKHGDLDGNDFRNGLKSINFDWTIIFNVGM